MTWQKLAISRNPFPQNGIVPTARPLPTIDDSSLVVQSDKIRLSFTNDRTIIPETLEPGTVVVDIGRYAEYRGSELGLTAVIDHHQLARGYSATELVYANRGILAQNGPITEIRTHNNPDLDAIVSVMLVHALATSPDVLESEQVESLVRYVSAWDSGALQFANIEDLKHSLGTVVMGLCKVAEDAVRDEVLQEMELAHMGEVFGTPANIPVFFGKFNERNGPAQIQLASLFIGALMASGYDAVSARGMVLPAHVPLEQDINLFNNERGIEISPVRLASEIPGKSTEEVSFELSVNTMSANYFSYLYAQGIMGGIIYKENTPSFGEDTPNRDYIDGKPEIQGSKIVIAISDQAGATIDGLETYLNDLEIEHRGDRGMPTTPEKEATFWKQGVPGRLIISVEGTVLTQEEIAEALRKYNP